MQAVLTLKNAIKGTKLFSFLYYVRFLYRAFPQACSNLHRQVKNDLSVFPKALGYGYTVYDLTELNESYLCSMVALATGRSYEETANYFAELKNDQELAAHFALKISGNPGLQELYGQKMKYRARIGWYAVCRALKPKVVIETGIATGIGSCIVAAALKKNESEGYPGYYYGLEINETQGYFFDSSFKKYGEIVWGDSVQSLKNFSLPIDLLITDSSHTAAHEEEEYRAMASKLSPQAIVIANNAHNRSTLLNFARQSRRRFVFFREEAARHWRPVGGMGIAFK